MRIRIRILIQVLPLVRIQGAKAMRIHADPGLDPVQTLQSQKVQFLHEKFTLGCKSG